MTDKHLDDALQDLRAELNVTPSPEFAAKVRQRIDRAPAKSPWRTWAWSGVAATCAVAVIAVALWKTPDQVKPVQEPVTSMAQTIRTPGPAPTADAVVRPDGGRGFSPGGPAGLERPASIQPKPATMARTRTEPEVLVPPDQLIAIRRLMAAVRAGVRIDLPAAPALFDPETGELIPPKPIEIPLITVDPLPGPADGRSGGSERK